MSKDATVTAVVAAFETMDGASEALEELKHIGVDAFSIKESAVLVREDNGELEIKESHHVGKGAVVGGLTGAVIGLVTGPVGWVTVGGAAVGALASKLRDTGFPDERLKQIGEALTPGTSALVAILDSRWVSEAERRLRMRTEEVTTEAVRAEVAKELESQSSTS